jgi:hypothetical protein
MRLLKIGSGELTTGHHPSGVDIKLGIIHITVAKQ